MSKQVTNDQDVDFLFPKLVASSFIFFILQKKRSIISRVDNVFHGESFLSNPSKG